MSLLSKKMLHQTLPWILIILGVVGFMASFMLTYDKIQVLSDASYDPSCNINPILSCQSVMASEQSNLLGVPNTIYGLVGYSVLITTGVVLAAGAKLKRWYWLGLQIGATLGVIFMHYLFFQGVYRINAICPWCFVVWMITIPIFWYITLYNVRTKVIKLSKKLHDVDNFAQRHHGEILVVWYLVIFFILIEHFWYFWKTLI